MSHSPEGDKPDDLNLHRKENDKALCLSCADLDHLVYLPQGNATLTRRSSKYSSLRAVVVKFSRTRKRYERQGILIEESALKKAEEECLADAEVRQRRRERDAIKREHRDAEYIAEFSRRISAQYPSCPAEEAKIIADHACRKYSGRVGRSAAAKEFAPEAITLAVIAHIRHQHTNYDELLTQGCARFEARSQVHSHVQEALESWRRMSSPIV
ncbi:MAG: DUF2293 domain-containing protein [Leptolyngbyaceae cyanobacterium MO_188.B28]|nr:DUF2293 domain-containing protein [Leptolyngbyaceae cyanobacterium MO_188.B28]